MNGPAVMACSYPRCALVGVQPCGRGGGCRLAGAGLRWAWRAVFEHAELAGGKRSLPGNDGMRRNACARCFVFGGLCPWLARVRSVLASFPF